METVPSGDSPGAGTEADDEGDQLPADLEAAVRSLRAKNRVLRAERTALAGHKYVLETVLETLKQKFEELEDAVSKIASGELAAEALDALAAALHDAHQIAEERVALEGELEAERQARLDEERRKETRSLELEEKSAGLEAELVMLRGRMITLEGKALNAEDVEKARDEARARVVELEASRAEAAEKIEALEKEAKQLGALVQEARAGVEGFERVTEPLIRERDEARQHADALEKELEETLAARDEARSRAAVLEGEVKHVALARDEARTRVETLEKELLSAAAAREGVTRELLGETRAARETLERERDEAHAKVDMLESAVKRLASELDETVARSNALEADNERLTNEREGVTRELLAETQAAREKLQREHDELLARLTEVEKTRELCADAEQQLARARADWAAEREALEARARQSSDGSEKVLALERELQALKDQLEVDRRRLNNDVRAAEERLAAKARECAARDAELAETRITLANLDPTVDALADTVDSLEKENTALATRLGETRQRGRVDVRELLVRAALLKRREARNKAGAT